MALPVFRSTPSDVPKSACSDIVHGERVPGQQDVDVTRANQFLKVGRAAGVDDDRPCDHGDAAARAP